MCAYPCDYHNKLSSYVALECAEQAVQLANTIAPIIKLKLTKSFLLKQILNILVTYLSAVSGVLLYGCQPVRPNA